MSDTATQAATAGAITANGQTEQQLAQGAAQAATSGTTPTSNSFLSGISAQSEGVQEAPPSAAQSAYEYQTYVAGITINVGSQLASLLQLPANSASNGDTIMQAFESLPYNDLVQVEEWLYQAGMYNNVEGQGSTTRPTFGVLDINAFNAMSQAILQAHNSKGMTLSQFIAAGAAQQVGTKAIASQLQPLVGGGNAYQVSLPNPDDIYQSAYTEFEQALGRAPTQAELDALTKSLDATTTAYQDSINQQQEQMSVVKYQAAEASRQAGLNPAIAPQVPTGTQTTGEVPTAQGGETNAPPIVQGKSMVGQRTTAANTPSGQTATQEQVQQYLQSLNAKNQPQNQSPAVQKYLAALAASQAQVAEAAKNPEVAAYFAQLNAAQGSQVKAPGDIYTPANTLTTTQAPTAAGAAWTQATTGANTIPYLGNQFINLADQLMNLMKSGGQPS